MPDTTARRMFTLVEPVAVLTYWAEEPTAAVMALGLPTVWDAYFAFDDSSRALDKPIAAGSTIIDNVAGLEQHFVPLLG